MSKRIKIFHLGFIDSSYLYPSYYESIILCNTQTNVQKNNLFHLYFFLRCRGQ